MDVSNETGGVVVVTGASSGIGEATAQLLARRGMKVVLGARRAPELGAVVDRINRLGGEALGIPTDVSRREDVVRLVETARSTFGTVDVFVSNAGVAPVSRLDDLRVDDWERMIDTNIKGLLYAIASVLPIFREQKAGHFVSVASTAGLIVRPTMAVYAATKFAVRAIAEGLRQESRGEIRVTTVSPGFVRTNLADSMTDTDLRAETVESMRHIALSPDAIARAICFAVEQPSDVDVNEIVVRPTAQN